MESADAIVIGGGVIGTSIAYHLAANRKVILLEKGDIGAQTSGACDKAIFLQSKKADIAVELARHSRKRFAYLEQELDAPIDFKPSGGMVVINKESHLSFMKKYAKSRKKAGLKIDLLDQQETLERQPCLSPNILASTYCKEDAEVNPLLLTQAFMKAAKRRGAKIHTHTEVTDIICKNDRIEGVKSTKGRFATKLVINAAGPYAPIIAGMANVHLHMIPRRGVILISEKIKPIVQGNVLCSDYLAAKHLSQQTKTELPPYGIGLSLGQTESGNLLIGSSREFKGYEKSIDHKLISMIAAHASRIVPTLNFTRIIRSMVGFRPFIGDGLPIIDKIEEMEGFIIATGHEGDGIALAPATGELVEGLIDRDPSYQRWLTSLKLSRLQHTIT
ncbi:NAD(P)/FAD-dependent oxidoreductase [Virgibacillus salexigens]|uniref:Sarcosine oxidase subunit beta n=1 Tax=Virgibacillus kapii TaxID=1638645 RepID=A0ABQ2D1N5_9BACI|nr:FAD-dependent oxidoreductase [Virgibacillus kapii]GGJ42123.1 sarcosine oxidase subunit beta [Virgibacillus kapii]